LNTNLPSPSPRYATANEFCTTLYFLTPFLQKYVLRKLKSQRSKILSLVVAKTVTFFLRNCKLVVIILCSLW
jgi:hypothetical protein